MKTNNAETYTFAGIAELYKPADTLPEVERHEIYAYHEEQNKWVKFSYLNSLWIEPTADKPH